MILSYFFDNFLLQIKYYKFKYSQLKFVFCINKSKTYSNLFLIKRYFYYHDQFYRKNLINIMQKS